MTDQRGVNDDGKRVSN